MSFDFPQQPRRRKGGMSGVVMFLIIGAVLFFFMQSRAPNPAADSDSSARPAERRVDSRIDRDLREADEYRRNRENVLGSPKSQNAQKEMPKGGRGNNGDWSIEDVDSGKTDSASTVQSPTKTKGKDGWSIEDVPTKKKSGAGFELNNSSDGKVPAEKSDWSLEDVDSKAKKTTEGDWSVEEVGGKGGN